MTRARVGQLLSSGPRPERAMLGTGPLAVAVGGKLEADKKDPYAVVSAERLAAYEKLSDCRVWTCAVIQGGMRRPRFRACAARGGRVRQPRCGWVRRAVRGDAVGGAHRAGVRTRIAPGRCRGWGDGRGGPGCRPLAQRG